jgi:type IV pilus assembly protein PilN
MIRVNLLAGGSHVAPPKVWVPAEQRSSLIGLGMLLATFVAVGGWWYYLSNQQASTETHITKAETRIEQLKDALKLLETSRTRKAELESRVALIARLREAKHAPVRMLHLLNASVPDGLWLMEIKQAGASVTIEGRAMSQTEVSDFAKSLQDTGFFKMPVEVVMTLMETLEETNVFRFLLKAESAVAAPPTSTPATPQPAANGHSGV